VRALLWLRLSSHAPALIVVAFVFRMIVAISGY
jgi:hypothetical protein